jgi:O-antigen/teichoic acid export membrane protein
MVGIFQGDRIVIGASIGVTALGIYSIAFMLTNQLAMVINRLTAGLMLPLLSQVQQDREEFLRRYRHLIAILTLVSGAFGTTFIVCGGMLITAIYGLKYAAASSVIGWFGMMQAVRLIRGAPVIAAFAKGDSMNTLLANIARVLSFPAAAAVALAGGGIFWIAATSVVGELLAWVVSTHRLAFRHDLPLVLSLKPFLMMLTWLCLAAGATQLKLLSVAWENSVLLCGVLLAVQLAIPLIISRDFRRVCRKLLSVSRSASVMPVELCR